MTFRTALLVFALTLVAVVTFTLLRALVKTFLDSRERKRIAQMEIAVAREAEMQGKKMTNLRLTNRP
jgi:hypothetical protein